MQRLRSITSRATMAGMLGLCALALPAQAIVSTSAPAHWVATDSRFDAVARLVVNGGTVCSGSLLAGGHHVLTAAHCVTGSNGALNVGSITLSLDGGALTARVSSAAQVSVYTGWNGVLGENDDLALLRLDTAVTALSGYQVRAGSALGEAVVLAGYGYSGVGSAGYASASGTGTLHWGANEYDTVYSAAGTALFDFDNGDAARSSIGGLGLGSTEAMIGPGDSGGPSFVEAADGSLLLVGVHSFGARLTQARYDINNALNGSYGELGGDTTLDAAATLAWLHSVAQVSAVPEPASALLLAAGGALLAARRRRQA